MNHNLNCLGYPLFSGSLNDLPAKKKIVVSTINQYSYCIAEKDADFKNALIQSDVLLPDGIGMTAAAKLVNRQKDSKNCRRRFSSAFDRRIRQAEREDVSILVLQKATLLKIKEQAFERATRSTSSILCSTL